MRGGSASNAGEQRVDVADDPGLPRARVPDLEQVVGRARDEPGGGRLDHGALVGRQVPERLAGSGPRDPRQYGGQRRGHRPHHEPPT